MSETAEERSKRQYLAHHRSEQWTYKHAIYYAQPTESSSLLDDMVKFKQLLRRKCPDQPFLIRIQLRNQPTLQAFLILYTTGKVDNLDLMANKTFASGMNVRGRVLSPEKLEQSARSIEIQSPHNLNKFFGKPAVKRWSVLNSDLIDPSLQYKHKTPITDAPDDF